MKKFAAFAALPLLLISGMIHAQTSPVRPPSAPLPENPVITGTILTYKTPYKGLDLGPKSNETEDEYVTKTLYPATVLLYSQDENGSMKMLCTATAYSHVGDVYEFATASHCATTENKDTHKTIKNKTTFYVNQDNRHLKSFIEAEVEGCGLQSRGDDFCIFKVTTDQHFPIVALGADSTSDSDPIVNIASPLGLGKQTFFGRVSMAKVDRSIVDDENNINWTDAMLLQLPGTNGGSSGSAIVCLNQRAICGFLVGVIGKTTSVAIPVSRFYKFSALVKDGKYKWYKDEDID